MNIGRSRTYLQINPRSHYHVSAGSLLRQEKAARRKQLKRRKIAIIVMIVAIITSVVLLSSRLGGSYIKDPIPCWTPPPPPRVVLVEFGVIYVLDEDPQWMQTKEAE